MAILRGIQIEGFGSDTASTDGIALTMSTLTPHASSAYEWRAALTADPGNVTTRVDPFRGRWSTSSITLRIARTDALATSLMGTPAYTSSVLGVGLTAGATSVSTSTISPTYSAGDVVYIGDEAILLGAIVGSFFTSCTRGMWGTEAAAHDAGSLVFGASPYWYRRVVRLIEHETTTGAEAVLWQGFVENVRARGPQLEVECVSMLQAQSRQRINSRAVNHARYTGEGSARIWRADPAYRVRRQPVTARGTYVEHYQIGDGTIMAVDQLVNVYPNPIRPYLVVLGVNSDPEQLPDELFDGADIWPLLVVDRDLDGTIADAISSTADLASPYHPLAIALALLMSTGTGDNGTYDVLGESWGMGMDYVDVTAFTDEITARPDLAVDRLVLGWDGEEVAGLRVVTDKLLRPFGYSLTVASDGSLGLCRLRLPSLLDRAEAVGNTLTVYPDQQPEEDLQLPSRGRRLVVRVGGEPFGEARELVIQLTDRSLRPGRLQDAPELKLDLSVIKPERLISGEVLTTFASTLIGGLALALDSAPMLRVRTPSWRFAGLADMAVGKLAAVDGLDSANAWWVNPDGTLTALDASDVSGVGLVVGLSQPTFEAWMTVDLLMIGGRVPDYIHLRAPSAKVDSWVPNTLTIQAAVYSADDAATFEVGDELSLWDEDGARTSTATPQITGIAGTALTLSGGFGTGTPTNGDIIRISRSTLFDNTAHISGVKRPFAYMGGGSEGEFEDVDGVEVVDVYGTEYFGGFGPVGGAVPDFQGLDDTAVGPLSATEAWPMDAWLGQSWSDREAWLLTRDVRVSQLMVSSHAGDLSSYLGIRPYASEEEMSVMIMPVLMTEGMIGAHVASVARIIRQGGGADDATDAAVYVRLCLYDLAGQLIKRGDIVGVVGTELDTPQWQPFEVDLELDAPVSTGQVGYLVLFLSSRRAQLAEPNTETTSWTFGTNVPSTAAQGGTSVMVPTSDTFLDDTAAARPNATSMDTQALTIYRWAGQGGSKPSGYFDMLWRREGSGGETEVVFGPGPASGLAIRLARYSLTYAQLRGLEWSIRHADIGRPPAQLLESPTPILGEVVGTHLTRTERAFRTPRPVHVGPVGTQPGSPYPSGYAQRWPRTTHSASGEVSLDTQIILPSTTNPGLQAVLGVLPTLCVPNFNDPVPDDLREFISVAEWVFRMRVYRITGTSWTLDQTESLTIPLNHWYTHVKQQGALVTELAHYSGDFPFKEGSVFAKDLPLIQPVTLGGDSITWDPATDMTPLLVDITVQPTGTPSYTERTHPDYQQNTRLQLALCGLTIYEVP